MSSSFSTIKSLKEILKKHQSFPLKYLGQSFLIDKTAVKEIIKAAQIKQGDIILEIGPGTGVLTKELAQKAKKVITVEKDARMIKILREELKDFKNIEIIKGDILKAQNYNLKLKTKGYKIVANLPFYLANPVIRKFLEMPNPPSVMILIVQKEVAQRICPACRQAGAKPPRMSILAVSVQFYAQAKIISYISKKSFWPQPKVDSAIIKIIPRQFRVPVSRQFREQFFKIVKAGFSHPRKQLINNLSTGLNLNREQIKNWLLKNKTNPSRRAETLKVDDWIKLTKSFP